MNKFFINTLIFFLIVLIVSAIYNCWSEHYDRSQTNEAVFIWGDSQMYRGLDIRQLSDSLGQTVFSSAHHGAGVYDFLTFVDKVPDSSKVIISFPECALYRDPRSDYNRSGVNIFALNVLHKSGYTLYEIIKIVRLNKYRATNIFSDKAYRLYDYSDSIVFDEPLEGFVKIFSKKNKYIQYKQTAYLYGIETLKEKGCSLCFISFPFAEALENEIKTSICRAMSDSLTAYLKKQYQLQGISIQLPADSLMMHDLSHMNIVGARHCTGELSRVLIKKSDFFVVVSL